ncbi:MAG TPA: AI-2E family transporter [Anaerolineaceae bacterium]|nr:AI-2E family transporter [Anaerolineaceae bacterium]
MHSKKVEKSPSWSSSTKLVVTLILLALFAFLLVRFTTILAPLFVAFLLAYLLYPIPNFFKEKLRISWKLTVLIIYLILLILFLGLITIGGFAGVDQLSSLIRFIQFELRDLPVFLEELSGLRYEFGGFVIDFSELDLVSLGNQLLSFIQPMLSGLGNVVGSIAGSAAALIGWSLFSILISYFILSEAKGARGDLIKVNIPGYNFDIKQMGLEISRTWNAFLRGQLIITLITVVIYIILLGALGVNFYYGLAFIAGLARFVPYIGPFVAWTTFGLVSLFQGTTIFGLEPLPYAILVIGLSLLVDVIMDYLVVPRLMGDALKVHPAAVLVAVFIFASLFGFFGVLLAAPVLATVKLIGQYVFFKMFDLDPWEKISDNRISSEPVIPSQIQPVVSYFNKTNQDVRRFFQKKKLERQQKEKVIEPSNRGEE